MNLSNMKTKKRATVSSKKKSVKHYSFSKMTTEQVEASRSKAYKYIV